MKYVILVGDGMADRPLAKLSGKTVLEYAKTPNMDFIAQHGTCGLVHTVPKGMKPGSDIANLALLGYDPRKYFSGRAPLEALSMGINLKSDEVAFRCNTVKISNGKMKDFSGGHIKTKDSTRLMKLIDRELGSRGIRFYPGVSYRNIMIMKNGPLKAYGTPPHDITDKPIKKYLPKGPGSDILSELMAESSEILSTQNFSSNMIWLWGQGKKPKMPKFPLKGSVITAVDLIKGMGKAAGLNVIKVKGATGYLDTNYVGKANAALKSLKKNDFVFVHVESPDEAGHEGNIAHKVKAIQDFDKYVVGTILRGMKRFKNYKVMVVPDHATPIALKTHSGEPVPFAIYDTNIEIRNSNIEGYSEKAVKRSRLLIKDGYKLLRFFLKKTV
jgi:2,3-bisphosphoglycerate-independent phosphoglycerate mutase